MAESIMHQGISQGHLDRLNGEIVKPIVWLTTDPSHIGHGLLVGTEKITPSQAIYMERVQGARPKNLVTYDKTMIRIKLRVQKSDSKLQSYVDYCNKNESRAFAKAIGVSAYHSIKGLQASEISDLYAKTNTKEKTWWLYKGTISPSSFEDVSVNRHGVFGNYIFDRDGREEFKKAGFIAPSGNSLNELANLIPSTHNFDQVKAFCFCQEPGIRSHFHIRGGGFHIILSLDNANLLHGTAPDNLPQIISWTERYRDELIACWKESVDIYFAYHPDRAPNHSV